MGISKQAVQQLVDGLEAEGVLARIPDPQDRRGRIIVYTDKGRAALRGADRIKKTTEASYRRALGDPRFAALADTLELLREGGIDSDETSS